MHDKKLNRFLILVLSGSLVLSGCVTKNVDTELTTQSTVTTTTETEETEPSVETTEQIETTVETSFVTSLPYLRTIDFDGEHIPDGIYMFRPISVDADGKGCTADIYEFPYLLDGDVDLIQEGDVLFWANHQNNSTRDNVEVSEHICSYASSDEYGNSTGTYFDGNLWGLIKQPDGHYILIDGDTGQGCITSKLVANQHFEVSENILILDSYSFWPFQNVSEEEHQAYLDGIDPYRDEPIPYEDEAIAEFLNNRPGEHELAAAFRYRNIIDFVYACNDLSLWGGGCPPVTVVVIKDQTITEMYLNSPQHQPWRFISLETRSEPYKDNPYTDLIRVEDSF